MWVSVGPLGQSPVWVYAVLMDYWLWQVCMGLRLCSCQGHGSAWLNSLFGSDLWVKNFCCNCQAAIFFLPRSLLWPIITSLKFTQWLIDQKNHWLLKESKSDCWMDQKISNYLTVKIQNRKISFFFFLFFEKRLMAYLVIVNIFGFLILF